MTQSLPASEAIKTIHLRIPKDSLIKLQYHENQELVIKFNGGREVYGKLKSWDKAMNLILDNCSEIMSVEDKEEVKRELGLIIVKGSQIESIALRNGYQIIDNPYENLIEQHDDGSDKGEGEEEEEESNKDKEQQEKEEGDKQQNGDKEEK